MKLAQLVRMNVCGLSPYIFVTGIKMAIFFSIAMLRVHSWIIRYLKALIASYC